MAIAVPYPLVNGNYHAFASIEVKTSDGNIYTGVKAVNFKNSLKPTKVRGTNAEPIGRTRGDYDSEGDIEFYEQQGHQFMQALGNGYGEKSFDVTVIFSETGLDTIIHVLTGCRIEEVDSSNSQGTDASTLKFTLNIMKIKMDGLEMLITPLTAPGT